MNEYDDKYQQQVFIVIDNFITIDSCLLTKFRMAQVMQFFSEIE